MIWIIILVAIPFLIWHFGIKPIRYWSNKGVKQGKPWMFFGDMWVIAFHKMSFCEFIERLYTMFPNNRYFGAYQFTKPTLIVRDPELIKRMMVKDFDYFTDHNASVEPEIDPLWGGNLIALKGQKWRDMRATLTGIFTSSKMKVMYSLMEEAAENFVKYFLDKNEDVIEVELKDTFTRYTNDVIATTAFGIKVDSLTNPNNVFYKMGREISNFKGFIKTLKFYGYLLLPKLLRKLNIQFFDKEVSDYFVNAIDDAIKVREEKEIVRPDLINHLLEVRKGAKSEENEILEKDCTHDEKNGETGKHKRQKYLTNTEITAQALIFFLAGFDTTSTALCFGCYEIATNKDVQEKLREEIKQTYKENNGKITYDTLLKMKYLDMVLSEMLRKWPPGVAIDRVCTKPYIIEPVTPDEKSLLLKPGDIVWFPAQGIHRDPAYYPNPSKLDPERFSDENKDNILPYTYLPFGTGPRNCIGSRFAILEIKALLFNLLLSFELVPTKKTSIPLELDKSTFGNIAKGGFWLGFKRSKI